MITKNLYNNALEMCGRMCIGFVKNECVFSVLDSVDSRNHMLFFPPFKTFAISQIKNCVHSKFLKTDTNTVGNTVLKFEGENFLSVSNLRKSYTVTLLTRKIEKHAFLDRYISVKVEKVVKKFESSVFLAKLFGIDSDISLVTDVYSNIHVISFKENRIIKSLKKKVNMFASIRSSPNYENSFYLVRPRNASTLVQLIHIFDDKYLKTFRISDSDCLIDLVYDSSTKQEMLIFGGGKTVMVYNENKCVYSQWKPSSR